MVYLDIPRTLLMGRSRYVVSTPAKYIKPDKIILPKEVARSVLVHDVAVDGESAWALGFKGPLPGLVFDELAIGVHPFRHRIAKSCILLTVTNETDTNLWFSGQIVGMRHTPSS